jgi:hypothetical protein
MENKINKFLDAIEEAFSGMDPRGSWPLNGGQVDAYFDAIESLDMYKRMMSLHKRLSIKGLAKRLPPPDILRLFLEHNAVIGLKVADKFGIQKVCFSDRIKYLDILFQVIETKTHNDIFCADGKNLLLSSPEVQVLAKHAHWKHSDSVLENKTISYLATVLNHYCYSLFFDIYMAGGFYLHGPYDVSKHFGSGASMLVRNYRDLCPLDLWPDISFPFKKMQILTVYKDLDLKINFANLPDSSGHMSKQILSYTVYADGEPVEHDEFEALIKQIEASIRAQTKRVNSLNDLDKVRKGAEIAYYLFRDFRESFGDDWRPPKEVEENIQIFGDKFVTRFKYSKKPDIGHWRKLYDPRNNYF